MPVAAPVFVSRSTTPDVPRYGLLSVADMPAGEDPHWVNGVEYDLPPVPQATADATDCLPGPAEERELASGKPWGTSLPFRAWAGFQCSPVGLSEQDIADYALQKLAAAEGPFVESQVWSETTPAFMSADTESVQATAVPLEVGVGLLEEWLLTAYAGVGAIHIPRRLAAHADHKAILHASGAKMSTLLGTPVSLGNYPNVGPPATPPDEEDPWEPEAPAAGSFWIVATGDVSIRRTPATVLTGRDTAWIDPRTNTVQGIAERQFVVTFDEIAGAVLVNLN